MTGSRLDPTIAPGCSIKLDLGLAGTRTTADPGESSGFWHWANVDEVGATSVAIVRSGFCVRTGSSVKS